MTAAPSSFFACRPSKEAFLCRRCRRGHEHKRTESREDHDVECRGGGNTFQLLITRNGMCSAAETLAAAAAESESGGFNQHDPARALNNFQKMRDVAKSKVAAAAQLGNMLDMAKELKISNEVLDSALGKLNSDDWRTRKIAVYDVMDEVIVRSQKAREEGDADSMKYYCEKVEKHIIPVFCDENWWVRKAAIHGIVKLSKDDPAAVQVSEHTVL